MKRYNTAEEIDEMFEEDSDEDGDADNDNDDAEPEMKTMPRVLRCFCHT